MARKKTQVPKTTTETIKERENKVTRRELVKSLTAGTLVLGLTGPAQKLLAQEGGRVCGTPENARRFIEGMLDPKVRSRLEENPSKVIAEYGLQVPKRLIPKTVKLPPEEDVRNLLKAIDSGQGTVSFEISPFWTFLAFIAFFAFLMRPGPKPI